MSLPAIIVGLPLLAAPIIYALRRWHGLQATAALGVSILLAVIALTASLEPGAWPGNTLFVLGRPFVLEAADRFGLVLMLSQAALIFAGASLQRLGRYFLPAGVAAQGLLAAAVFVRPFVFAALFIGLAAALLAFVLVDEERPRTRGPLRYLTFTLFGMLLILLAGWRVNLIEASPADAALIAPALALIGSGFVIWLAVVPFHSWLSEAARTAPPAATAFVATIPQNIVVVLMLSFLNEYPWLHNDPAVYRGLTLIGGGMVLAGAVLLFGQRNFGRSLGYALMIDFGAVILGLGLGTRPGAEAALGTLIFRGLALTLWAIGLTKLRQATPDARDDFDAIRGLGRRYPVAAAAVLLGMLSLAGFPLTAGFPIRFALINLLAVIHPSAAVLLLLGLASTLFVVARGLAALIEPVEEEAAPARLLESRSLLIALGAVAVAVFVLGVLPQLVLPYLPVAAGRFSNLAP